MTEILHPYLREASRRAGLIGQAPIEAIDTLSGYRRNDHFMPRNQREAGIADRAWETRLPPLGSWSEFGTDLLCAITIVIFIVSAWWGFGIAADLLHGGM